MGARNSSNPGKKIPTRDQVHSRLWWLAALLVACLVITFPHYLNKGIDWVNNSAQIGVPKISQTGFNLGLDLQGGSHLIYAAKTDKIASPDVADSVEGVRDVIERRVRGGLGVSEPLVQTTRVGEQYRIIVELPGVTDVKKATTMIGETPVLEFKEENNNPQRELTATEKKEMNDFNAAAQKKATAALAAVNRGLNFADGVKQYSQDETSKDNGGDLGFITETIFPELYQWAARHKDNEVSRELVKSSAGFNIVKRLAVRDGEKQVTASHLLLCFKGAEHCDNPQYSKDEARQKIEEIKREATVKNFASLVTKYSTEPGAAERGGDLGTFQKGAMVKRFEDAVFPMAVGTISDPVETEFGWHLIYKKAASTVKEYHLARIFFKTKQATDIVPAKEQWKSTGLSGKQLEHAEVVQDPRTGEVQVSLNFNDEGTKLFGDVTRRNLNRPVGIFLDGTLISAPIVNQEITSGSAVITGNFNLRDAKVLSQRLNSGALPVPVELISQKTIDATLGADSLAKSFKAGIVGLLLVILFMIVYYRLPGLLSVVSLLFYAVLSLTLFKLIGLTMTLSGIAGFILSIGMAVDANILVFERLKEELRGGKMLRTAMEESFIRAWPSIWDSHITALISCVFLIWFGTGFIQGFATILALGTLINLFTAITVTRTIMRLVFHFLPERGNAAVLGYRPASAAELVKP